MFDLTHLIQSAFARQQFSHRSRKNRRDDLRTGPEAAGVYRSKHPAIANRASSIRKLERAARIEAGLRPLKTGIPTKRELHAMRKASAQ